MHVPQAAVPVCAVGTPQTIRGEQTDFKQDSQTSWSGRNTVPGPGDITKFLTVQIMPGCLNLAEFPRQRFSVLEKRGLCVRNPRAILAEPFDVV